MAEYESTKDSGIAWIGTIPFDWKTHTLYQLVTQVKNKNKDLLEENLLSLSYGRIKRKDINSNGGLLPESFNGYNIIDDGDIVLRLTDLQNDHTSLRVGLATEKGIITSAYTTLHPIKKTTAKYLYYLLHSYDLKKGFYGMGSGVRQGLNYDEVKELRVVLPSDTEQSAIAAYLDEQCAKINTLIVEAKDSIEEYKQWKSSIIFEAVTKGLNHTVQTKDSGIKWIGKIPVNWSIGKIKHYADFMPKSDLSAINADDLITFTPMECIKNGYFENRSCIYSDINGSYTQYSEGDIVFAKVTPCFENGNASIMQNLYSGFGMGSSELFVLRSHNIVKEFLFFFIRNENFVQAGCSTMTGTGGLKRVSSTFVQNCPIPIPPIDEQQYIVEYLYKHTRGIDSLIIEKQSLISDLESYKKSLIYETVTGKRKVV